MSPYGYSNTQYGQPIDILSMVRGFFNATPSFCFKIYELCVFAILWHTSVCGKKVLPAVFIQQTSGNRSNIGTISAQERLINSGDNTMENGNLVNQNNNNSDELGMGLKVLCFFIPVVGLTLYIVWKDTYPKKSKSAGKAALIGFLVWVGLSVFIEIVLPYIFYWQIMSMYS